MLQQILRDMYVEPELLAELSEEQRQLLFYKIRQEQVRRWAEHESQEEAQESKQHTRVGREGERKNIQWLHGSDGDVWVWVMGEAPGDRPYEQIIRELIEEKACRQAHLEAQELWCKKQAELKQKFRDAVFKEKTRLIAGKWKEEAEDRKVAKQEEEHIREELEAHTDAVLFFLPWGLAAPDMGTSSVPFLCKQKREEEERQSGEEEVRRAEERRARELYVSLERERHAAQQDDEEWSEQKRRSKAADEEMARLAHWARDEHKSQSLRARRHAIGCQPQRPPDGSMTRSAVTELQAEAPPPPGPCPRPALRSAAPPLYRRSQSHRPSPMVSQPLMDSPSWVRFPRPKSRESIIAWFCEDQRPKRAGYERNSDHIAPWFHGIITREESEHQLANEATGSFLVRVSEMIWGYTLSYRTPSGFKHFLIDATGDFYSFLGVDQSCHASLADLVDFHK
ncbi:hypothetical protein P4O66_013228, partial [Electrophorus voltai]